MINLYYRPKKWGVGRYPHFTCIPTHDYAKIMAEVDETTTWPELAIGLYDKLTGRGAEITYEFEDFQLAVPSKAGDDPEYAHWRMDGVLKIRTKEE